MKKNRKFLISLIPISLLILLFLFIPTSKEIYDDGGTVAYRSRLYTFVQWNRYMLAENPEGIHTEGINTEESSGNMQIYQKSTVYWYPDHNHSLDVYWNMEQTGSFAGETSEINDSSESEQSVILQDRITDSWYESMPVEGDIAEQYGVYPSDDLQFALYSTYMEIDHSVIVSLNTITQYDENGEVILRTWIQSEPEDLGGYGFSSRILSESTEDNKISIAGLFKITDGTDEIISEHITLVQDSVF